MSEPKVNASSNTLRFAWGPENVMIEVSNWEDDKRGLYVELAIHCTHPTFIDRSFLYWCQLNLKAPQSRKGLAKDMSERWNMGAKTKDDAISAWEDLLLQMTMLTVEHIRQGEPVVDLWSNATITPIEYLVYPIIPKLEPVVLLAPPASGKSYLSLALSICAQLPMEENPLKVKTLPGSTNVLYLDYETNQSMIERRFALLSKGFNLNTPFPLKYRRCYRPFYREADVFQKIIMNEGIGLVIIDSLGAACGAELKEAESALQLSAALRQLNVSSLIVAHPPKGKEDNSKTIYGSLFFEAYARQVFLVRKYQDRGQKDFNITLDHTKTNDTEAMDLIGFNLSFAPDQVRIESRAARAIPGAEKQVSCPARILDILTLYGSMTNKELEDELGESADNIRQATGRLKRENKITRLKNDKWARLSDREEAYF